ncbi:hypothetical protein [Streptomyces sp. V4I8]|uniref:hypothetical protein n=1 Tax=Streptomyces sp. V4I8 TaxID=3156469 RepID=UPI003519BF26
MRDAHARGARALGAEPSGPEAWGWEGRTLGRRAGHLWLRVLSMPEEKAGGRLWEGAATAAVRIPESVPRPKLVGIGTWTNDGNAYRAELTEYVTLPVLQSGGPVLEQPPNLPDAWWAALRRAVDDIATVPTDRHAVRQQWIDRGFPAFLGIPPVTVTDWTTGHGDFHWGNLTGHPLTILDWEGWGRTPVGFDVGMMHAYTLRVPETAARLRAEFAHVFDTEAGRTGELVAVAQLLQVASRGGHPELAPLLAEHAHKLTGVQPPQTGR